MSLQKTNPELVVVPVAGNGEDTPGFLGDRPPFDDIKVRIAMQKAINNEEIATAYYKGNADPTPWGVAPRGAKGLYVPYDEWPEEVKWLYEYDPDAAEKLLDDAGYPRGADGIRFATNWDLTPAWGADIDLAQLEKNYWAEIGVDVFLNVIADGGVAWDRMSSRAYEGMTAGGTRHKQYDPVKALKGRYHFDVEYDTYGIKDPTLTAMIDNIEATTDREEYMQLVRDMDMYFLQQMWSIYLPIAYPFVVYQPWLKGYRGELGGSGDHWMEGIMYWWVDQELQKDMGH